MNDEYRDLQDKFYELLQKSSYFKKKEIDALWAILRTVIGSAHFSLAAVSRNFGRKLGRNFLTKVLKKYCYIQRKLVKLLFKEIASIVGKRKALYLVIDDTLVNKKGEQIFWTFYWYDHARGRQVRAISIVNVALVVDNQVVLSMPYLLLNAPEKKRKRKKRVKEQDRKITAAINMVQEFFEWLEEASIPEKNIKVLADSWYSDQRMIDALRQTGGKYLVDGKINLSVQVPDHEAIKKAKTQIMGRPRTRFVKYQRLDEYLGDPEKWKSFTDSETGEKVSFKKANVILKSQGKVLVYAYKRESCKKAKYLLHTASQKHPPTPRRVYREYRYRWRIEESHRDLKQQFGLGKCQCRDGWVVHGFMGLVYFAYSVWKWCAYQEVVTAGSTLACPTWAQAFHELHVQALASLPGC